jgi:hypothetical protein
MMAAVGLASRHLLGAGDVERVRNAIQHTIAVPPDEVAVVRRLPPPGLGGGTNGATNAHSRNPLVAAREILDRAYGRPRTAD